MACPLFPLQSVYWERTVVIFGEQRSWAVLLFTFLSASSDCTSSVVYWPFAGSFLPRYISGMAVGEGLSGVVAALLSQLQYLTCKDPECTDFAFGPTQYFVALAVAVGCSAAAFWCLENLRSCQAQRTSRGSDGSVGGGGAGELLASTDHPELSEQELLSPGGTELYDEGEDGFRLEAAASSSTREPSHESIVGVGQGSTSRILGMCLCIAIKQSMLPHAEKRWGLP